MKSGRAGKSEKKVKSCQKRTQDRGRRDELCEFEEVHCVDEDLCLLLVGEPLCDITNAGVENAGVDDVLWRGSDDGGAVEMS